MAIPNIFTFEVLGVFEDSHVMTFPFEKYQIFLINYNLFPITDIGVLCDVYHSGYLQNV